MSEVSFIEDERNITHVTVTVQTPHGQVQEVRARKWFFGVRMFQAQFFDATFQQWFWGIHISQVFPGTPASSKVEQGDIITRVDGVRVETVAQFVQQIEASQSGNVTMRARDVNSGAYLDFSVQLWQFPNSGPGPGPNGP
jgi:hypothetical protein